MANCQKHLFEITNTSSHLEDAERNFRESIETRTRLGDIDSILLSRKQGNLGEVLSIKGDHAEALELLRANMDKHIDEFGMDDEDTQVAVEMYEKATR